MEKSKGFKRFLVFCGDHYYPSGGMNDFHGSYDTIEAAKESLMGVHCDWYHIYDMWEDTEVAPVAPF